MKPRILIYSTAYYPLVGGAEVAVKEITDRLGVFFDFDLVTARISRSNPRHERVGAVNVHRLGLGSFFDKYWLALLGARYGRKLHKKSAYSMTWAIMASYGGFAASSFQEKLPSVPFLLTLQEGDDLQYIERKTRLLRKRFHRIFERATVVQCISTYLANWAKSMGAKGEIKIVPNGVDLNNFKFQISNVKLKKAEGEKVVVTTSRLVKKNGVDDLIRAVALLPENVKLWILGIGPEESALKKLAEQLGVDSRIVWCGFIDNDKLFPYLKEADVFVRPSLSEGLGNSFLEAMASGLPTIGTPVGGIVDFLREGETGWLAEVRNPKNVAGKISFILDPANKALVDKIARQGQDLASRNYQWDDIARKMSVIFKQLAVRK